MRLHFRLGSKCRSNPQDTVFRLIFEISTPKERFLAKNTPECPKTPQIGSPRNSPKSPEIPRNSPKFPEIPRNPPKFPDFRMVCAPHRNYEYWVKTLNPRKTAKSWRHEIPRGSPKFGGIFKNVTNPPRLERKSRKWTFGHNFYQFLHKLPVLDTQIPNSLGLIDFLPNL